MLDALLMRDHHIEATQNIHAIRGPVGWLTVTKLVLVVSTIEPEVTFLAV